MLAEFTCANFDGLSGIRRTQKIFVRAARPISGSGAVCCSEDARQACDFVPRKER
jgi:hypothetical protein